MIRKISVTIASHGRAHLVPQVLPPLLEDPATLEVVLIADDDPEIAPAAKALSDKRIRVVEHQARSDAASRQLGVESAKSDLVLLLDDDVVVDPGTVSGHVKRHGDSVDLVVLGHMPVDPDYLKDGTFAIRSYASSYDEHVDLWKSQPGQILQHFWTGNVSIGREVALRAKLDHPDHRGLRSSDYRFGLRLDQLGCRAVFAPELTSRHLATKSMGGWIDEARKQGAERALNGQEPRGATSRRLSGSRALRRSLLELTKLAGRANLPRIENRLAWTLRGLEMEIGAKAVRDGTAEERNLIRKSVPLDGH